MLKQKERFMVRMKNILTATMGSLLALTVVTGCAGSKPQDTAEPAEQTAEETTTTSTEQETAESTVVSMGDYDITYGESKLYTHEDMDAAVKVIMAEFDTWTGTSMQHVRFTDDATCKNDVAYCNSLKADDAATDYDEAIVIKTDFHSPSAEEAKGTAWEPDTDYKDYEWHLARTNKGEWVLLTWGY